MFNCSGSGLARGILEEILKPLSDINATTVIDGGGGSSDTGMWVTLRNVPGVELYSADEDYFFFHHSRGMFNPVQSNLILSNPTNLNIGRSCTKALLQRRRYS